MTPEAITAARARIEVLETELLYCDCDERRADLQRRIARLLELLVETSEAP